MANIVTVFVRLVAKSGVSLTVLDDKPIIEMLLDNHSYNVEPRFSMPRDGPAWDFQFGRRWSPGTGAEEILRAHPEHLDSTWVRWADEGDDADQTRSTLTLGGVLDDAHDCCYQFDAVEVLWAEGHRPDPALGFRSGWDTSGSKWRLASPGTYLALNNRHNFETTAPKLPSPTTPVEAQPTGIQSVECPRLEALREHLDTSALKVDYLFRGRLVHREARRSLIGTIEEPSEMKHFHLDDWDNFADPDYLQKMNMPGPAILDP